MCVTAVSAGAGLIWGPGQGFAHLLAPGGLSAMPVCETALPSLAPVPISCCSAPPGWPAVAVESTDS